MGFCRGGGIGEGGGKSCVYRSHTRLLDGKERDCMCIIILLLGR